MRSSTEILVKAMHILANDIQSDDGVANAAIYEAAQRLEEQNQRIKRLEEAGDAVAAIFGPPGSTHWADENQMDAAWNNWTKAKEDKP